MTEEEEKELLRRANLIKDDAIGHFIKRSGAKYDAGQREHGGLITFRVTLEDLEDEIIDLWFYLQAFKSKLSDYVTSPLNRQNLYGPIEGEENDG
jgi:hypothetical protein